MATAAVINNEPSTDIAVAVAQNPVLVLVDQEKREALYEHIQREIDAFEPDITTAKGRDAIKSLAFKITRTKTAIDDAGKKLNEDKRAQINAVDAERRAAKERLTALATEVRKPLTDWEEAEKARIEGCRADIDALKAFAVITLDDTAASVRERGKEVWEQEIDPARFGDMLDEAVAAKDTAVVALKAALARLTQEEADKAELERLRNEAVARELAEQARIAAEAEKARQEAAAAEAEERKAAAEKAEADRIEAARKEAAETAQREAERARQAEIDASRAEQEGIEAKRAYARQIIEHIKNVGMGTIGGDRYPYGILLHELEEKIAINDDLGDMQEEVRAIRDATLANVRASMERQHERDAAKLKAEEEAEAARIADEQRAAREANQAHRTKLKTAAKEAIIALGIPDAKAVKLVQAIVAGDVPHVRMEF